MYCTVPSLWGRGGGAGGGSTTGEVEQFIRSAVTSP